jgi:alkylation response protein AidB-like acyl-CoA dehydrogenase
VSAILDKCGDLGAFRLAVREWTQDVAPSERCMEWLKPKGAEQVEIQKWWMAERRKVGLATPHWPIEYGGAGLGLAHQTVIADEFARAKAPNSDMFVISLNHVPHTLIPHGTEAQKRTYLPQVAAGTIWCQGFSEPNAGSDLASLKTRAVRDGDHYVINGHKIWSTYSMFASHCLLLARTDSSGKKQQGISYFILDMATPGVEVRPIHKSNGSSTFGEIFLTDARIPAENLIGAENEGWAVSQSTLASERGILSFDICERDMQFLIEFFRNSVESNAGWLNDSAMTQEFATLFSELQALRRQVRALLAAPQDGSWSSDPSIVKIIRTELNNRIAVFRMRSGGLSSQFVSGAYREQMYEYLETYGPIISGGSNEIQRNLIAERGLGMPKG